MSTQQSRSRWKFDQTRGSIIDISYMGSLSPNPLYPEEPSHREVVFRVEQVQEVKCFDLTKKLEFLTIIVFQTFWDRIKFHYVGIETDWIGWKFAR